MECCSQTMGMFDHAEDTVDHTQNKGWLGDQHGRSILAVLVSVPKHKAVLLQTRQIVPSPSEKAGTKGLHSQLLLAVLLPRTSDDPYFCFLVSPFSDIFWKQVPLAVMKYDPTARLYTNYIWFISYGHMTGWSAATDSNLIKSHGQITGWAPLAVAVNKDPTVRWCNEKDSQSNKIVQTKWSFVLINFKNENLSIRN